MGLYFWTAERKNSQWILNVEFYFQRKYPSQFKTLQKHFQDKDWNVRSPQGTQKKNIQKEVSQAERKWPIMKFECAGRIEKPSKIANRWVKVNIYIKNI